MDGVRLLSAEGYALTLEIDAQSVPIQRVINAVLEAGPVADITIEDPPLEEVIAHIYGSSHGAVKEELKPE